jgi:hypothetical protein
MHRLRHRVSHLAGAVSLSALLLVGLALRGHQHADHAMRPCATCVVAQHSPAVNAPAPATISPLILHLLALASPPAAPPAIDRPTHPGRAPPSATPKA